MTKATKTPSAAKTAKTAAPRKAAAPTATKKPAAKAAPAKPAKKAVATKRPAIPADQRRHYVEVAAYYIAERRGFAEGDPLADWAAAEAEIDRLLAAGRLNP
jgi:hypothetical protein